MVNLLSQIDPVNSSKYAKINTLGSSELGIGGAGAGKNNNTNNNNNNKLQ